jgi:hypothetical protein
MKPFVVCAALVVAISAHAASLHLSLTNSLLAAYPGSTVHWTADLSDPGDLGVGNSILITGSSFDVPCQGCAPPPVLFGKYTDVVGAGFVVLAPAGNCCGDPQTVLGQTIGQFAISPTAPHGLLSGFLEVDYAIFSVDPNDPNFDPGQDTIDPDVQAFVPVTVDIAPEPGTWWMMLGAMGAALGMPGLRRRVCRARS